MPKYFVRNTADAAICERWLVTAENPEQAIAIAQGDEYGECEFVEHLDIGFESDRDDYEAEEISDDEAGLHVRRERLESAAPHLLESVEVLLRQIVETSAYDDAKRGDDPGLLNDVAAARAVVARAKGETA